MIYPEISVEEWVKRYSDLEILEEECPNCERLVMVNIPFVSKSWVGLASKPCVCGGLPIVCQIPRDEHTLKWTNQLYQELLFEADSKRSTDIEIKPIFFE